jgi:hypothetical protein
MGIGGKMNKLEQKIITPEILKKLSEMFPQVSRTYSHYDVEMALESIIPIAKQEALQAQRLAFIKMVESKREFVDYGVDDEREPEKTSHLGYYNEALDDILKELKESAQDVGET